MISKYQNQKQDIIQLIGKTKIPKKITDPNLEKRLKIIQNQKKFLSIQNDNQINKQK